MTHCGRWDPLTSICFFPGGRWHPGEGVIREVEPHAAETGIIYWWFTRDNQGCGLGQDVSVLRRSQDVLTSRLGLVLDKIFNVSVSEHLSDMKI